MIDPGKIPTFTGNLENLETQATSLKTTAGNIRTTGKDVHNAFQALDPVYDAPEQNELLNSTIPVRDKADDFAKKLESVGGALQGFATAAKPLVDKMDRLRKEAQDFVAANKDDKDWQKDQKKVDQNARMVSEVGTTWVAFQGVERDAASKITALVGGTKFVVDDGSHQAGMYGFKESDVKDAKETPWGTVDKREYTGWRAAWEWTKDNVGGALKGFFVDGVWGTIKGLGSMVNVFDWDNFKKTWSGIGDVFGGVSAYLMTPYDWAMDKMFGPVDHSDTDKQKAALRNFGKSLVAWDEWGKDPARAFGTVLFNGVTIGSGSLLKLGKAGEMGQAGKLGAGAKVAGALGKAGALVDPMTYLGKATNITKIKVGDFMEGLKAGRAGVDDLGKNLPTGTGAHPVEPSARQPVPAGPGHPTPEGTPASSSAASAHPSGTPSHPSGPTHASGGASAPHPDGTPSGPVHASGGDSAPHPDGTPSHPGGPKQDGGLPYTDSKGNHRVVHGDGTIRDEHGNIAPDTKPVKEPHKSDLPNISHDHANEHQAVPAKEPAKVLEGAGGPSHVENAGGHPTSSHPTSTQPANMHSGDGAHPTGGGTGGANTTPHTGGHAADHPTGGGSGSHGPSSGGSHTPSGGGGTGSHGPSGDGSGSHAPSGGGHDTPGTGGSSAHGHENAPHHGDDAAHGHGDHDAPSEHGHEGEGHGHDADGHGHDADGDSEHAGSGDGSDGGGTPPPHNSGGSGGNGPHGVPLDPQPNWHGDSAGKMKHYRRPALSVDHLTPEQQLTVLTDETRHLADDALKDPNAVTTGKEPPVPDGQHKLASGCAGSLLKDNIITSHTSTTKFGGQKMPKTHKVLQSILDKIKADADAGVGKMGRGHGKCSEIALINDRLSILDPTGKKITTVEELKEAMEGSVVYTETIGDQFNPHTGVTEPHGSYFPPCETCRLVLPQLGIHPHS
ncbi:YwqJ-related putative deaminase [Streptomyces sp. NPDC037389]|uniref:YwqJ-related putative deaminase n=1 Tax=Streptomyces sp. NPDC037389 TaxID=3155369 RepID=UPI0033D99732